MAAAASWLTRAQPARFPSAAAVANTAADAWVDGDWEAHGAAASAGRAHACHG